MVSENSLEPSPAGIIIIIIMTLFKCQMYLARTALIGDTFQIELEFRNVGFWGEGKTGVPGEKPLGARTRTNNKLNPHMTPRPGIEPGPHWWEASALTTAPSLLCGPKSRGGSSRRYRCQLFFPSFTAILPLKYVMPRHSDYILVSVLEKVSRQTRIVSNNSDLWRERKTTQFYWETENGWVANIG